MAMVNMEIDKFLEDLSSNAAVPGGGGACGLVAAIGMSLGNMVLSLTSGKKKYAEYQKEVEESIVKAEELTKKLAEAMDKDAEAFEPLSKAYSLPKNTEEEISYRQKVMEGALVRAAEAPLNMMELIMDAIKLIDRISIIGSRLAISDAGVGIQMCKAALNGAALNIYINTKMMQDREKAESLNKRADELIEEGNRLSEEIYKRVYLCVR